MSASVSVIVPVYNMEHYLSRCVESLLQQSYENMEVILVDDGSVDCSPDICDGYAEREENVRVIHKQNGGLSSARLAGFEAALGDYVLFVDSDDYIAKSMVEKLVYAADINRADLSICGYYTERGGIITPHELPYVESYIVGRENIMQQYLLPLLGNIAGELSVPGFLCIRLLRRSLIQKSFFKSERIYYKEDHVFDLLYGDSIHKIAVVREPLYYYCFNQASLSNAYRRNKWEMYRNLYRFYLDYMGDRGHDAGDRLQYYILSAVLATIDNGVLSGSYRGFLEEMGALREDALASDTIANCGIMAISMTQKVSLALFRLRFYRLLYLFRKWRLKT